MASRSLIAGASFVLGAIWVGSVLADANAGTRRPLEAFRDCEACPEMIVLPMGSFVLGGPPGESRRTVHWEDGNIRRVTPDDPYIALTEGPLHTVTIDLPIAMGRNEVTRGEWMACVADGGCGGYVPLDEVIVSQSGRADLVKMLDDHPVIWVSYNDIQLYLAWLNAKVGADVYRLPTEAEWEYAARAGTSTPFAQGERVSADQVNVLADLPRAEITGPYDPDIGGRGYPVRVQALDAANGWGLRHMSGTVSETTMSCWSERHHDWPTSSLYLKNAPMTGCDRVAKGGVFWTVMDYARPAARGQFREARRAGMRGFRVVRDLAITRKDHND